MRFIKCQSIVFVVINHGYDVHHKNEIKTDNRLQNLVYLTRAEHAKLHSIGNKHFLGKKHSEQSKAKISASNIGKKHSEQSKAKIRDSRIGKKLSKQTKEKIRDGQKKKQVYCVELNKIFASINIAAQELSLHRCNISNCCKGKLKTCGGYHFQFINV